MNAKGECPIHPPDVKVRRLSLDNAGRMLQMVFSLKMFGGMFMVWAIINVAGCEKPPRYVPYTGWGLVGKGQYQLLLFPAAAVFFFVSAAKRRRLLSGGYSLFAAAAKTLGGNALAWQALYSALWAREGPGLILALVGAMGISMLGLIRLLRHTSRSYLRSHAVPHPHLSGCIPLRLIGLVDCVLATVLAGVGGGLIIERCSTDSQIAPIAVIYVSTLLAVSVCVLWVLGYGIRRGEGWAAMVHVASALLACCANAVLMLASPEFFIEIDRDVAIWSLVPLWSAIVLYVLLIRNRRDINWPIRFSHCDRCGRRRVWPAKACPVCGMSLKPVAGRPGLEHCIYCENRARAQPLLCRACRGRANAPQIEIYGDRDPEHGMVHSSAK